MSVLFSRCLVMSSLLQHHLQVAVTQVARRIQEKRMRLEREKLDECFPQSLGFWRSVNHFAAALFPWLAFDKPAVLATDRHAKDVFVDLCFGQLG